MSRPERRNIRSDVGHRSVGGPRATNLLPALALLLLSPLSASASPPPPDTLAVGSDASHVVPVEQLRFYTNAQGFTVANAWGDPASGPHSNYIRMAGGTASGHHTHSFSYYGVVVSGTVVNEPVGSGHDRPLRTGSFWYQRAGEAHVTKCVSPAPCLFFVTSAGPFDYLPAP